VSSGRSRQPTRAELERMRVALALCLTLERDDPPGFELLRASMPDQALVQGLVNVVRSLARAVRGLTGEEPESLFHRLIDDILAQEVARWW
jgi:PAS domain-containing protein